ncbi:hypothetical protein [Polaribacter sp.]|uniref:hypothetical protein n=1 Tax=Polaribacter sp. TaxID=1920175 RepID=UPI003F6A8643
MKNTVYILSFLILFQSCYTYKNFEIKDYDTIQPKKVKIELKNSITYTGKIVRYENNNITLKNRIKTIIISITEIDKIKGREFSLSKTILLSTAISATILIGLVHLLIEGIGEVPLTP